MTHYILTYKWGRNTIESDLEVNHALNSVVTSHYDFTTNDL